MNMRLAPNVNSEVMKVKELQAPVKDLNKTGFSVLKENGLLSNINNVISKRFNESELIQITVKQLTELANQHTREWKNQLINAFVITQHSLFIKNVVKELRFEDNVAVLDRDSRELTRLLK